MEAKREQALVGFFVIVAAVLLVTTVFLLSGAVGKGDVPFHAYFKNAGGMQPGREVRYQGGPVVGHVTKVRPDPGDPGRMRIDFSVKPDTPIKTDSVAAITSTSPLGENFLGIFNEKAKGPAAPRDSAILSKEYSSFSDIGDMLSGLSPEAQELLKNLNERAVDLKETIERVNAVLDEQNRANLAASLSNIRGMLEEDRPAIRSTLKNINASSEKFGPLIDDLHKTLAKADDAISHIDDVIGEDRPDLHESLDRLKTTLASANNLTDQLNNTLGNNAENLDDIIENMRQITANMKEFTDTIKRRPYTLIRSSNPKPHEPGQPPPK
jgi:phospholipid/cholesterol/gamma-HCH transport system substrate-binding protein